MRNVRGIVDDAEPRACDSGVQPVDVGARDHAVVRAPNDGDRNVNVAKSVIDKVRHHSAGHEPQHRRVAAARDERIDGPVGKLRVWPVHRLKDRQRFVAIRRDQRYAQRQGQAAARFEEELLDSRGVRERVEDADPRAHRVAGQRRARNAFRVEQRGEAIDELLHVQRAALRLALAMAGKIGNDQPAGLHERRRDERPRARMIVDAVNET